MKNTGLGLKGSRGQEGGSLIFSSLSQQHLWEDDARQGRAGVEGNGDWLLLWSRTVAEWVVEALLSAYGRGGCVVKRGSNVGKRKARPAGHSTIQNRIRSEE